MHRHVLVVRILDLAAKTEHLFSCVSVSVDVAGPLFRDTVVALRDRYKMRRDDASAPHFVRYARLVFPDGGDKAIEVLLAPESVYLPSADAIVAEVARLSPFTFGPR
jgi:hypothetical protein